MTLFYFKNESVPIQKNYFNFLNTFLQFFPHIFWFLGEILKMKDFYVKIRNLIRLMLLKFFLRNSHLISNKTGTIPGIENDVSIVPGAPA